MKNLSTLMLLVLLGTSPQLTFCMEVDEKERAEITAALSLITEANDSLSSQNNNQEEQEFLSSQNPEQLCELFKHISIEFLKEKDPVKNAQSHNRLTRNEVYKRLNEFTKSKEKTKKMLDGMADDLTDDEAIFDELLTNGLEDSWRRIYDNTKNKTDVTIVGLQAKKEAALLSLKKAAQNEKQKKETVINLQNALACALMEETLTIKEKEEIFKKSQSLDRSIVYTTKRIDQNEEALQLAKKLIIKSIKQQEDIISQKAQKLEELLISSNSNTYLNDKDQLEKEKTEATEKKESLTLQLNALEFHLPKTKERGSTTRQAYNAVSTIASSVSSYWFSSSKK